MTTIQHEVQVFSRQKQAQLLQRDQTTWRVSALRQLKSCQLPQSWMKNHIWKGMQQVN